jgi:hypothetical protein
MSRIYQALKRASEEAKQRKAPPQAPEPKVEPGEVELGPPPWEVRASSVTSSAEAPPPIPELGPDPLRETPAPRVPDRLESDEDPKGAAVNGGPYRTQVRTRLQAALSAEQVRMAQEGKLLYHGEWLSARQIQRLRRREGWRDTGILIQLLLLYLVMGFTSVAVLWLLIRLALPA